MLITKNDGTQEAFKKNKLERSLKKAGASHSEIQDIVNQVQKDMYEGIRTQEIYNQAFKYLYQHQKPTAAKYSVRRALFGLGPTGFPFEKFLAKLFEAEGYTTKIGTVIKGKCTAHEIDVAAYKSDDSFAAEAKFHSRPGIKSDLKVALYCHARQIDLEGESVCKADDCGIKHFWLITNTRFTKTAEKYAACTGLKLLSWNYPKDENLHTLIKRNNLYPVTVIPQLSNSQKRELLAQNIILCRDIVQNSKKLHSLHLSKRKHDTVISLARQLCEQS